MNSFKSPKEAFDVSLSLLELRDIFFEYLYPILNLIQSNI